jgi:ribosomal-protein-alanine N-acetyltransferase
MEMNIHQQDLTQEAPATSAAEKSSESAQVLKFGFPTDEELPALAKLCVANVSLEGAEMQETLEKLVRLRERTQVARTNGHVLGFVAVEPDGPVRSAAYLRYLAVKLDFRRQGVGTSLLEQARQMALAMSRKSLILRVDPSDEHAVAFVRKAGFTTVGALSSKKSGKLRLLMSQEL